MKYPFFSKHGASWQSTFFKSSDRYSKILVKFHCVQLELTSTFLLFIYLFTYFIFLSQQVVQRMYNIFFAAKSNCQKCFFYSLMQIGFKKLPQK